MKLRTSKFPVTTPHIFHWATLDMIMIIFVFERTGFSFVVLTVMALFVCDEMPKTGDLWRKTVDRRWWLQKLWTVLRIWLSDTLLNRPVRRYKTSRWKTESFAPSFCCKGSVHGSANSIFQFSCIMEWANITQGPSTVRPIQFFNFLE